MKDAGMVRKEMGRKKRVEENKNKKKSKAVEDDRRDRRKRYKRGEKKGIRETGERKLG